MSSYQFVNSLAACYGGQQQQQQQAPQQRGNSGNSPGDLQAASPAGGEYYNPSGSAAAGYPGPCYSPQQHYPAHPYATPASTGMGHAAPTGMIDYTQLQPQPRIAPVPPMQHHPQQQAQHLQQQALHQEAQAAAPLLQGGVAPSVPGKYADSTSSTSVASPQDLSTSTSRNSPTPLATPGTSKALTSPGGAGTSRSSGLALAAASPPSGSSRGVEGNSALTNASSASSPASSTSSTSSTGNNSSNKGNNSGGNPPQIYPWMKRVHIGQSEYRFSVVFLGRGF